MRLFRTVFWLGITIYCLPSFNSQTTAPNPSPIGSQCRPTKAADTGRLCEWEVGRVSLGGGWPDEVERSEMAQVAASRQRRH
jgi:hypothetical protein